LLNVPELKQMGIQSYTIFDKRKLLSPMARVFLQILREKRNLPMAAKDRQAYIGNARRRMLQ
jgi:hypothetical protein